MPGILVAGIDPGSNRKIPRGGTAACAIVATPVRDRLAAWASCDRYRSVAGPSRAPV